VAGGVDLAGEDFCEGGAAGLAGIPGFEQRGDLVDPLGGVDVAAGGEGDDGVRVDGGDGADELILTEGKREGAVAAFGFGVLLEAGGDDDGVGVAGELDRVGGDDGVGGGDREEDVAADDVALPLLDDDLVRAGGEGDGGGGLEGAHELPVVE
jgi:hypothetical protein